MNKSSYYSYSIITGVLRNLSDDIICVIKEYLYIHLNRRSLNKEYIVFLEKIFNNKNKKYDNILLTRYGLKNKVNSGYICENTGNHVNHISLDTVLKFKMNYYVLGVKIYPIYDSGFTNYDRNHIILRYMKKHYSSNTLAYNNASKLMNNQDALKKYIRIVMDHEECLKN